MTSSRTTVSLIAALVASVMLQSCSAAASVEGSTPMPTATTQATPTNTPRPTPTSRPRSTPTFTPAPVGLGVAVWNGPLQITVLKASTHDLIVPGGKYYYYAKEQQIFLDLGVLVTNSNPEQSEQLLWSSVYIVEADGQAWAPSFGDTQAMARGSSLDPYKIPIVTEVKVGNEVLFSADVYMRLIFVVARHQTVEFHVGGSPPIIIEVP